MATSSVPSVKANLVTQLQARGGLAGVQVTNGSPLPNVRREFIWVGGAEGTQDYGTYGVGGLRQESYRLEVTISVLREGIDAVAADTRCFALSAELESQLRSDPTVNGACMTAKVGDFRLTEAVTQDGMARQSELQIFVDIDTWI